MWREVTNLPSLPKKGESLMVNSMLIVGSVDGDRFERFGVLVIADRVTDLEAFDAYQSADFAALHLVHLGFTQSLENHQVFDAGFDHRDAVTLGQCNGHS